MQTWVDLSEILRNLGLALAALCGLVLAWRKLTPERRQTGSAAMTATLDVHGAFLRGTDWGGARLRDANLTRTDLTGAVLRGVDFLGARMVGTILRGADLTGAINLTLEQVSDAVIDDETRLPADLDRHQLKASTAV